MAVSVSLWTPVSIGDTNPLVGTRQDLLIVHVASVFKVLPEILTIFIGATWLKHGALMGGRVGE